MIYKVAEFCIEKLVTARLFIGNRIFHKVD